MKQALIASALTLCCTSPVYADIRINGFANFIGGMTSSDETVYGYDDSISFSEESLFALQASGDINDQMSATVQILARGEDDYEVEFEWAYLSYRVSNNVTATAGRFRLPLFRYSDSLDVGYSYHWIAAPRNVYDIPFNNMDGFRLDYSDFVGDWEIKLGAALGTFDNEVFNGNVEGDNTYMLSAEVGYEWLNLRGVYGATKATFNQQLVDATISQVAMVAPEFADFLAINEDSGKFIGIGLDIDHFTWFIKAEYTEVEIERSYTPTDNAWYVSAGLRLGKWTPSVTYEDFEGDEQKGLDELSAQPEALQPALLGALQGLNAAFAQNYTVATATLRYDYDANIAFKVDISRYDDDLNDAQDATLARFAINYVF
ncbi:topoisomerase IV [Alteromonas halophila]|uniref:Topoisomerase IV n=1 Tax=Alteromonas halophila TaxID=516698 RepID=A0A918JHV6_9ALTE|nr:topoisomerase IV [Alteromonas halophila]GGW81638.1 hypothetical protein GCM10007391_13570 [Alteromonas halophila]